MPENSSLQPVELAILFHNQMQHFKDLKDNHDIDFKMSPEEVYKLIETAYAGSLQVNAFSFHVLDDRLRPVRYLTSVKSKAPSKPNTVDIADIADIADVAPNFESLNFSGMPVEEVELVMTSFKPEPRLIPLMFTEDILESLRSDLAPSFFSEALGQELKKNLDLIAGKMAWDASEKFPSIEFNTEPSVLTDEDRKLIEEVLETQLSPQARATLMTLLKPTDSYVHRAQEVSQVIEKAGDMMYSEYLRGGVSRLLTSPSAGSYLRLNAGFTTHGAQPRVGAHSIGEIYGIPVLKITSHIVPDPYALCIWRNDQNPVDASIAFATQIPFFFDVEAKKFGVMGDYRVLNGQYIRRAQLANIRSM